MPTLCLVEVTQLHAPMRSTADERYFQKKSRQSESSSHADMRRAISTKFCTVIEVVRAIILGPIHFLGPIHSFAARWRRKCG